ncbi:MAG: TetR family transcriptional regulator C-terminal domain-containing protein [Alphaproteobacteria bacterium]|nr:TetR family transcriptional regulator C-terminal domain-containing protein [Alphaproteobacteria bacterium]
MTVDGGRIRKRNVARILEAAEGVFAESGFRGATTAAIAARAGLPKANLHYYFRTKKALYRAVLDNILELWLGAFDQIRPERDPAEALGDYIAAKIYWSRTRPNASKVFANEVLHGAPILGGFLARELRARVEEKAAILRRWMAQGRMRPVDPVHLVFAIWAMTQHYADFEVQVRAVLGRGRLGEADYAAAAGTITALVLDGCGIARTGKAPSRGAARS